MKAMNATRPRVHTVWPSQTYHLVHVSVKTRGEPVHLGGKREVAHIILRGRNCDDRLVGFLPGMGLVGQVSSGSNRALTSPMLRLML